MWNRHRESEIHDIQEIGSRTKLFITFKLKVIRHEEGDTQSFYADCFYIVSSQTNQRTAPVVHKVVWPRPALKLESLVRRHELNSLTFSKIPKILSPRFRCMTSFTFPGPNFYLGFLFWHRWMAHPLRVRVNTCINVAPNPSTKRKVLILIKPKARYIKRNPSAIILHLSMAHFLHLKCFNNEENGEASGKEFFASDDEN